MMICSFQKNGTTNNSKRLIIFSLEVITKLITKICNALSIHENENVKYVWNTPIGVCQNTLIRVLHANWGIIHQLVVAPNLINQNSACVLMWHVLTSLRGTRLLSKNILKIIITHPVIKDFLKFHKKCMLEKF